MRLFGRKKAIVEQAAPEARPQLPQGPEVGPLGMRAMADHRNYLLSLVEPLPPFGMLLLDALGLTLCEDITAPYPLPRATTASAQGYAVRSEDLDGASHDNPARLDIVLDPGLDPLQPGQAVVIDEHQVLPEGADAVLPAAFAGAGERGLHAWEPVGPSEYVREAGSDVDYGQEIAHFGQVLEPRLIALLAGNGIDKVIARPRPRIVVVSTGKDLVEPGQQLPDYRHIHDANGYMLAALARGEGCQVWRIGVVSQDPDEVRETISDQLIRADLIVCTGGFREGDGDLLSKVLPSLGAVDFAEVAMQPGRTQGFALIGEDKVPMVMLPGDPVGAYVSYHAFVRPLIRKLMGMEQLVQQPVRAITRSVIRSVPGIFEFARASLAQEGHTRFVEIQPGRHEANLSDLSHSNALVLLDEGTEVIDPGAQVWCWPLEA